MSGLKSQKRGKNHFHRLPIEIVGKILSYHYVTSLQEMKFVCKRWYNLLRNINKTIRCWQPQATFDGYAITEELLKISWVIPTAETAKLMQFGYTELKYGREVYVSRLVDIFLETAHPKAWLHLPHPTWDDVLDYVNRRTDETTDETTDVGRFRVMLYTAAKNPYAYRYLLNLCLLNRQQLVRFPAYILSMVACCNPFDVEYVDWFVNHPLSTMSPYGFHCLIERGLPLDLAKKYAEIIVKVDWNGFDCVEEKIDSFEARSIMYDSAYHAYEWEFLFRNHEKTQAQKDKEFEALTYFYPKASTKAVRNLICVAQNAMIGFNGTWVMSAEERHELFLKLESLIDKFKQIHPVEKMIIFDWYKTDKPYIREKRWCPPEPVNKQQLIAQDKRHFPGKVNRKGKPV